MSDGIPSEKIILAFLNHLIRNNYDQYKKKFY